MADFHTHLSVAAAGSGLCSTLCLGAGIVSQTEVVMLWSAGMLGGILPDIDSDNSTAIRIIFTSLATLFAFLLMFNQAEYLSVLELWVLWLACYLSIRYLLLTAFIQFTRHRGIFHSLLAGLFFCFCAAAISHHFFILNGLLAWLVGIFVLVGFLIHLLLDEFYSVDFMNKRLKQSAGTAFKLIDYNNAVTSGLMGVAVILMFFLTPSTELLINTLTSQDTWQAVSSHFLPAGTWFQVPQVVQ